MVYVKENEYPLIFRRGSLLVMVNPSENTVEAKLPGMKASEEKLFAIGEAALEAEKAVMSPQSFAIIKIQ